MVFSRLEEIEARFNFTVATASLRSGGWKACFYVSTVYVIAIFPGRHYMESRPKFNLRRLLFGWNMLLALFSALGVRRVAVPIFTDIISFGWDKAICSQDPFHRRGALWMYVFGLSKIPELFWHVLYCIEKAAAHLFASTVFIRSQIRKATFDFSSLWTSSFTWWCIRTTLCALRVSFDCLESSILRSLSCK